MIGIEHYVVVSSILFVLGVLGIFLNRKNVIVILMAIELILLAVNINLVAFSAFLHDLTGQIFQRHPGFCLVGIDDQGVTRTLTR